MSNVPDEPERRDFQVKRALFAVCLALLAATLIALGTWQVERLAWKRDLIARVEERVHASPVPAPRAPTGPRSTPSTTNIAG